MNKIISAASAYIKAGLSVLPVSSETKAPLVEKGVDWKSVEFTGADRLNYVDKYFINKKNLGIGLCCGAHSGNLYVFDFDNHQGDAKEIFQSFCNIVEVEEVIEEISPYIVNTKTGGYHLAVRTKTPRKTEKIARRKVGNKIDCSIESRAEGGYVVTYPTKGYFLLSGSAESVPEVTEEQFDILYSAALSFNEYASPNEEFNHSRFEQDNVGELPGNQYDSKTESIDEAKALLVQAGWTHDRSGRYWTRPDKKKGVSATFGKIAPNVFYNFSSSAGTFEDRKAYTPFQILGLLKFNSNFSEAARYVIDKYNLRGSGNPKVKRIYGLVRENLRKGFNLTTGEINDLAESNDIPVNEVAKHVKTAAKKYELEFEFDKKKDIEKAEIFLKNHYEFRLDVISKLTQMRRHGQDWQDINVNTVYRDVQHEGVKFKMENLKSLLKSDFVENYNPFQEYFYSRPKWNGIDYIGELCKYVSVDDPEYFRTMFEKALVRTIACALIPEYYNRLVFVMQAEGQEIGKSYFVMYLNPFRTKYYTDEPLKDNKDSRFALTENFIYNLEELDGLSRMELSHMKATISTRGVKDRVAYGTHKEYFPRCCSFWGSTNRQEFLNDDKNTRWLIFNVKKFDWNYSKNIKIDDVWAQAWHLFNKPDYKYDLTSDEANKRDKTNEDFRVIDYEYSILTKHFEIDENGFMTNAEVYECMNKSLGGVVKLNTNAMKLGKLLSTLGYQRDKQGNQRGWKIRFKTNFNRPADEGQPLPYID